MNWMLPYATGIWHRSGFESKAIKATAYRKSHPKVAVLVDDIGLEPMTFRTSSGCSSQLS